MAFAVVGAVAAFGLWLDYIIPDKPPAFVETVLGIPSAIKEGIHSVTSGRVVGGPPSTESYKKHAEEIRKKYGIDRSKGRRQ
jgi:hypothetical protein